MFGSSLWFFLFQTDRLTRLAWLARVSYHSWPLLESLLGFLIKKN